MNHFFSLSFIMPVLAAIFLSVIIIVLILVNGRARQAQTLSIQAFEALANELKADNAQLKAELAAVKETLGSINAMMKEIQ